MIFFLRTWTILLTLPSICVAQVRHIRKESMKQRDNFKKTIKCDSELQHELVFAINQTNIDALEKMLLERSTPGNDLYQQWLTFDEIGKLTRNVEAADLVEQWLNLNGASISLKTPHQDYITATASIAIWERMLHTTFYIWEDHAAKNVVRHIRSEEYHLPEEMMPHIAAIFYTCQPPPVISKKYHRQSFEGTDFKTTIRAATNWNLESTPVTVPFLNSLYQIPSNTGEPYFVPQIIFSAAAIVAFVLTIL